MNKNENIFFIKVNHIFQQNSFLKHIVCGFISFFIVLVLFYIMSILISSAAILKKPISETGLIEFIRSKPREFLEERQRKLPQKKPKELKPPKMQKLPAALTPPEKTHVKMNLPNIKGLLKGSGPAIGGLDIRSDSRAVPIVRIEPQYPRKAAIQGIEGWVLLQFDISPTGSVRNIKILNSKPTNMGFERAAARALQKWKYRPTMEEGKAISQIGEKVQLDFKLE